MLGDVMSGRRTIRLAAALSVAFVFAGMVLVAGKEPEPTVPKAGTPSAGVAAPADGATHVVQVYYFRTNTRCTSCRKIEAFTDGAVKRAFAREMKDGKLAWQVINVQETGNEHFIKDYQLAAKSVVVVDVVDGRQARWKNLSRIWQLLDDEPMFARYVEEEVRQYLEGHS
jgi:hypothetical protein